MPLVTIIIPIYNTKKYLRQCLKSVVSQTYANIEIIIINDASTDNSLAIIKKYMKYYPNIILINNDKNIGVSASRNIGLNLSKGDYIYFLDSDDYIQKNAIEKMVTLARKYNCSLVEASYKKVITNHTRKRKSISESILINVNENKDFIQNHLGMVWNKLYKKELIQNLRFPKNLRYEDNAFIYPLLTKTDKVVVTTEVLYFYRIHLKSFMLKASLIPNNTIMDLYKIANMIKRRCVQLGTYKKYQDIIDYIIQEKTFDAMLQASTWIKISHRDKKKLITALYSYNKEHYNMPEIKKTNYIENRIPKHKRMIQIKKYWLLHYIDDTINKSENYETAINNILSKYKR